MLQQIPKWQLQKIEVIRNGVLDREFSGYDLQKDGIIICKFSIDSLGELKKFFEQLDLSVLAQSTRDKN